VLVDLFESNSYPDNADVVMNPLSLVNSLVLVGTNIVQVLLVDKSCTTPLMSIVVDFSTKSPEEGFFGV
jgi:hypothetical protein